MSEPQDSQPRIEDTVDWIGEAQKFSTQVLEPVAAQVDHTSMIPAANFDELAARGFYGIAFGSRNPLQTLSEVGEILVSGCTATAFVWAQHHGTLLRLATSRNQPLKERYLAAMQEGKIRAGVSGGGYAIPERARVRAHPTSSGYTIWGDAPFVTGWGLVDAIGVTAYDDSNDETVTFLIEASNTPRLTARPLDLVAANASNTVAVTFDGFHVDSANVMHVATHARSRLGRISTLDRAVTRINGSLALGIAARCLRILDDAGKRNQSLVDAFLAYKDLLARAVTDRSLDIYEARARCSRLASDVAGYCAVVVGSGATMQGGVAERCAREANFALVCATTPEIKAKLLANIECSAGPRGTGSLGTRLNGQ